VQAQPQPATGNRTRGRDNAQLSPLQCNKENSSEQAERRRSGGPSPAGIWRRSPGSRPWWPCPWPIRCSIGSERSRSPGLRQPAAMRRWWAPTCSRQRPAFPTRVFHASEFRYAPTPLMAHTLTIRGHPVRKKTADTLAALLMERDRRALMLTRFRLQPLGIKPNPCRKLLGRWCPHILDIAAASRWGWPATKTFLVQLLAFYGPWPSRSPSGAAATQF